MPDIKADLLDDNVLCLSNFPIGDMRKVTKLKLFLQGKCSFDIGTDKILITSNNTDLTLVFSFYYGVIDYLEKNLSLVVSKNDSLLGIINKKDSAHNEYVETKNILIEKKQTPLVEDSDFKNFCKFCDNHLQIKMRDYQYEATYYLCIGKGGFNFSVPGAGKTIITYAAYEYMRTNNIVDSILVIGPLNSYNAWNNEYDTCFGSSPDLENLALLSRKDIVNYFGLSSQNQKEITFINIDKATRYKSDLCQFLQNRNTLLIIDEGHKEKNPNAQITQAVLEITKYAKARIILTGTPMPNGYEDLFSLMNIYSPYEKLLPFSYSQLQSFTKNGASERDEIKIMESIKPYYSRVSKKYLLETKELLAPIVNIVPVELSDKQVMLYEFLDKVAHEIDNDLEVAINLFLMKAIAIRKMQVSANPALLSRSIVYSIEEYREDYMESFDDVETDSELLIKADNEIKKKLSESSVARVINEFENNIVDVPKNEKAIEIALNLVKDGKKVIIWEIFVQNMNTLKSMLEKKASVEVGIINGSVTGEDRQFVIDSFKTGNTMILIANPSTLAESISLHKVCQNAIYVNRNFNAAQFIQSKDRIHRINMPLGTTATYYFLINENTVDEKVNARLEEKEQRMLRILDSDEIEVGGFEFENSKFMSNDDILSVYRE